MARKKSAINQKKQNPANQVPLRVDKYLVEIGEAGVGLRGCPPETNGGHRVNPWGKRSHAGQGGLPNAHSVRGESLLWETNTRTTNQLISARAVGNKGQSGRPWGD